MDPVEPPAGAPGRGARPVPVAPRFGPPPVERSDAARNRARLLEAARRLIDRDGAESLTMDRLVAESGVGKGTIFRRFGSRAGLFQALLDDVERDFQSRFLSGPPPLGPGAAPIDRLCAFGRARIELTASQGTLMRAAEEPAESRFQVPARRVTELHIATLLRQAGVEGDVPILAFNLHSVLETILMMPPAAMRELTLSRLADGWDDLVRRLFP